MPDSCPAPGVRSSHDGELEMTEEDGQEPVGELAVAVSRETDRFRRTIDRYGIDYAILPEDQRELVREQVEERLRGLIAEKYLEFRYRRPWCWLPKPLRSRAFRWFGDLDDLPGEKELARELLDGERPLLERDRGDGELRRRIVQGMS